MEWSWFSFVIGCMVTTTVGLAWALLAISSQVEEQEERVRRNIQFERDGQGNTIGATYVPEEWSNDS